MHYWPPVPVPEERRPFLVRQGREGEGKGRGEGEGKGKGKGEGEGKEKVILPLEKIIYSLQ